MTVSNAWFQNPKRKRWTWKSPCNRSRNQIDYINFQQRFRNAILYSKSMPGADCDGDHVPVVCMMRIKLKKFIKPSMRTQK